MDEEIKNEFDKIWLKINEFENKTSLENNLIIKDKKENEIFEIENDKLIITRIMGKDILEKTKNITLLTLLGYKQKLGKDKVPAKDIRENVAINSIPLENFASYVKELIPQSILKIGKTGPKIAYKLTTFGEAKAIHLMKEVLKDESK